MNPTKIITASLAVLIACGGAAFAAGAGGDHPADKGAEVMVSVVDDEGDPVSGATITAQDDQGRTISSDRTDLSGKAAVWLRARAGHDRVVADYPPDYTERDDTDGPIPGRANQCHARIVQRCIALRVDDVGSLSFDGAVSGDVSPGAVAFEVRDDTPEPRLLITRWDTTSGRKDALPGGALSVTQLLPDGRRHTRTYSTQTSWTLVRLADAGRLEVQWTPPAGYRLTTPADARIVRTISRMTELEIPAVRSTTGVVPPDRQDRVGGDPAAHPSPSGERGRDDLRGGRGDDQLDTGPAPAPRQQAPRSSDPSHDDTPQADGPYAPAAATPSEPAARPSPNRQPAPPTSAACGCLPAGRSSSRCRDRSRTSDQPVFSLLGRPRRASAAHPADGGADGCHRRLRRRGRERRQRSVPR